MQLPCGSLEIGQLSGQFDGRTLNFTVAYTDVVGKPAIHFTGTVSADGRTITGQLSAGPQIVFRKR